MKDTNKSQAKGEVKIEQLEEGFNALSVKEVDQKQNNLDKDGEREKFNNLSKDGHKEVPKKREPEENTDGNEKKDEAPVVIKKEMPESEGKSSLENGQRVNTQMDDLGDLAKQMQELKVEKEEKEVCLQSRGPSGGVGRPMMYPQAAYRSFNPDYNTGMSLPPMKQGGKRSMDNDFEDPFYKYNRPAEMVNYGVNYSGGVNVNLLEQNLVYKANFCGGKMYTKQTFPDMTLDDVMGGNEASGDIVDNLLDEISAESGHNMMQAHNQMPLPPYSMQNGFPMDSMGKGMNDGPSDYMMGPTDCNFLQQKQDKGETSDYESPVCSPGSDISLNSPPPSNQSHDSGYGAPSPASDMAKSPASRTSVSTYSSSPPRDGNQWGDIRSPMSVGPTSPPQTVPDPSNASKYIDDHVELLHDVLNVIGNDIKQEDQMKKKLRQPCPQPQMSQPGQLPQQMAQTGQHPQQIISQPSPPGYPLNQPAPPYPMTAHQSQMNKSVPMPPQPSQIQQLPSQGFSAQPMANGQNGQVIILPPASTASVMSQGVAPKPIQPMGTQPMVTKPMVTQPMTTTTGSFVIVPGPPTTSVNSTPVPVAPVNTNNGPCQIIIVTPQTPQPQPAKKKPLRPLKPKVPGAQGDKTGSQGGEKSPGVGGNKMLPKNTTNALQNARLQQQKAAEMQKKQANLINVARRMVAEISREQLPFQDEEGDTYLHVAVCKTDPNMVKALLERLTRENMHHMIDLPNKHRQTPLYLAVAANQAQMVQMFVERNANPDSMAQVVSSDGKSFEVKAPIHMAASNGAEYLDTLKELLKSPDLNLNIVNSEGHTALHCAILNHGRPNNRGSTPKVDSLPIIEALIKAGIEPNSQDKKSGKTPLMYAIERKDSNLVEHMLRMFDPTKLRSIVKSQAFDGSSCIRIAEGLRGDFPQEEWTRLYNCLNCAQSGQVMNNVMYSRVY